MIKDGMGGRRFSGSFSWSAACPYRKPKWLTIACESLSQVEGKVGGGGTSPQPSS
jgi:hypothetical protein